ncbi:phage portal protein [Lysinibacillus sp. PLM2]|nr:phage portal protein [Lysinibacillus sp. PLM2]
MSKLQAFFSENAKKPVNVTRVISKRFVDSDGNPIEWEFGAITPEMDAEIKKDSTRRTLITQGKRKGQYNTEFDPAKYQLKLTVASVVYPDLKDADLQNSYGVFNEEDLINKMLLPAELQDASMAAQEANGFEISLEDMVEEAKN